MKSFFTACLLSFFVVGHLLAQAPVPPGATTTAATPADTIKIVP